MLKIGYCRTCKKWIDFLLTGSDVEFCVVFENGIVFLMKIFLLIDLT